MKTTAIAALSACGLLASGCGYQPPSAEQQASAQQEQISERAQAEVGIYQPTNFTRKRLANRIGQMLDSPNLATISYAQGLDGRLRCIGHTIGFPLPSATQTTSPSHFEVRPHVLGTPMSTEYEVMPQSDPDQLYSPTSADGTWVLLVNSKGDAAPAYFEGHVETFISANKPDASLIAQDCTE